MFNSYMKIEKEKFFGDILGIYNKFGYMNRDLLFKELTEYDVETQLLKYHGLKKICKELGIEYRDDYCIKKEDIIEDVLNVYNNNEYFSSTVYYNNGKYSKCTIQRNFGSWSNLMDVLNIPLKIILNPTKEDIIKDAKNIIEKYQSHSSTIYRKYGKYSQGTIDRLFGSWCNLVKEIGYKPICEKIGKDEMIKKVSELYEEYGFLSAKLINDNCDFTYQALTNYYSMKELSKYVGSEDAFLKKESTGAKMLYKILVEIFGESDVEKEYCQDWLRNDMTGHIMYIDFYIKSIDLAIEYDGLQHYKYVKKFYSGYKQYIDQRYRDILKQRLLIEHGILLLRFTYKDKITKDNVLNKLLSI